MKRKKILGLVLRGGLSSRMGVDKASLQIRPGLTQLDYALQLLGEFCVERAVSVGKSGKGDPLPEGVEEVIDPPEVEGPIAGVLAGLEKANGKAVLAIACDMPFLRPEHLLQLTRRRDRKRLGTCFLSSDGRPEPLCAIYEADCAMYLRKRIAAGSWSLRKALESGDFEEVEPVNPEYLANVNDPESAELARARLESGELS